MDRLNFAIGFAGRIKSGKTTIANAVAARLGLKVASFGDLIRSIAESRNLDVADRALLQQIGEALIDEGWPQFCMKVLLAAGWESNDAVVIEGIRHLEAVNHLKSVLSPLELFLVYVDTPQEARSGRLSEVDSNGVMQQFESHSTEQDTAESLKAAAHLIVSGVGPVDAIVAKVLADLEKRR